MKKHVSPPNLVCSSPCDPPQNQPLYEREHRWVKKQKADTSDMI